MRTSRDGSERSWRAGGRGERGTSMIEFVIVLTLVFLPLLWGLITFGYAFSVRENMTHSAQEALRRSLINAQSIGQTNAQIECQTLADARSRMSGIVGSHNQPSTTPTASDTRCANGGGSNGGLDISTNYVTGTPDGSYPACTSAVGDTSSCITVTMIYQYGKFPIISPLPGIFSLVPGTIKVTATERLR